MPTSVSVGGIRSLKLDLRRQHRGGLLVVMDRALCYCSISTS
jgi:hypothetical protein